MDLIANIIASAVAFIASVAGSIMAYDICISADRTCAKIIRKAAGRLAAFDRQSGEAEWIADLCERRTVREKYQHAIGCFLVAGKMRRQAETVTVALSFQIADVGTVPLSLKLNSRVVGPLFVKAIALKPLWIKRTAFIIGGLYLLSKFIRSANASLPPGLKVKREHLNQYKTWGYGAHIIRKGIDLDLGKIFQVMVLQPERIPELMKKVAECLEPINNPHSPQVGVPR
ncbi:hypothetical protein CK489_28640 [Bradyrhizobium sp. UFLA03-84]|uniref:hypothetical protein n=1 Tax=Bradyrhizobium sp. UFLA03-84 TaxID=418599 RepID=UPI000BADDD87|nr:hypothetical protein [Bradyrhizobium sp. UFLA03-84]PAY05360.1 hypothetical protein CK489_28640 [Bradyrhizobium sp. UFLA03-84]